MAFVSAKSIVGESVKRHHRLSDDLVLATDVGGSAGGFVLRLSLSKKICKSARFMHGDRVDILFDTETNPPRGLIKRVNDGTGWKLYVTAGKGERLVVKTQYKVGLPSVKQATACTAVDVNDEGILFDIPASADFTKNLREKQS